MFQLRTQKIESAPRHVSRQGCPLGILGMPKETGIREGLQDMGGMTPELKKRLRARVKRAASKINNTRRCAQERNWEVRKLNGWVPRSLSADLSEVNMCEIENEIREKGLTAPRITPADIEANIASEHYFTAADGTLGAYKANNDVHVGSVLSDLNAGPLSLLTFCVLVLRNGFTVTGEAYCFSPENFKAETGREIARENAVQKIGPMMGYALKSQLQPPSCREGDGCEPEETRL